MMHARAMVAGMAVVLALAVAEAVAAGDVPGAGSGGQPAPSPAMSERVQEIIEDSCMFCHGEKGEASNPIYPRLAGQNRAYMERQLKLFRSGQRRSDIMNEQAGDLTDEEIAALAAWFAGQPPQAHAMPEEPAQRRLWEVGRYVFLHGDPFADIPPCTTCHGPDARGSRTLPRLAGQHPRYIVNQLLAFKSGRRTTDNAVMRAIARNLSRLAMEGVALYLSTLKPQRADDAGTSASRP